MKKIFVVVATEDYEGSNNVRAFEDKGAAELFAHKLRDYQSTKPKFDYSDSDVEGVDRFSRWCDMVRVWEAGHPGGIASRSADSFDIDEIGFEAAVSR